MIDDGPAGDRSYDQVRYLQDLQALTDGTDDVAAPEVDHSLMSSALVDILPVAVYVAVSGARGPWLYASPRIAEITGFTSAEFIADPGLWARQLHPDDRSSVLSAEAEAGVYRRDASEYRMMHRDGRVVWVRDEAVIEVRPGVGEVQSGLLSDITERKRTELLLAAHAAVGDQLVAGADRDSILQLIATSVDDFIAPAISVVTINPVGLETAATYVAATGSAEFSGAGTNRLLHSRKLSDPAGALIGQIDLYAADSDTWVELHHAADVLDWAARLASVVLVTTSEHERLNASLAMLSATLDSTGDGILAVDHAHRIAGYNQRFLEMFGLPAGSVQLGDEAALTELVANQLADPARFLERETQIVSRPDEASFDEIDLKDGRFFERYSRPQRLDGRRLGRVWSFRDMTAHRQLERQVRSHTYNDTLTDLANRAMFMQRLAAALDGGREGEGTLAVLLLDLDDFKTVNDGLGHVAGDKLLVAVAERLRGCLRFRDTAARLGGDEFALLLEDLGEPQEASYAAERILAAVSRPLLVDGQVLSIKASIGIAVPEGNEIAGDLMRNADLAMYTAKREGGAGCRMYMPGMHAETLARLELKADLERAITAEQLVVHYQPVVDLSSGLIVGLEALVRWVHPTRGFIGPMEFIPLAEETGLIERLGRWVLRQACAQAAHWRRTVAGQEELTVSVNLSPRQLSNPNFPDEVRRALWAAGLPASGLTLEITESTLAGPGVDALGVLAQLKTLGVGLALDDFGTGYSSLGQLVHYPLDVVKVDKSFVDRIDGTAANSALIKAVLHIATALDLTVTVEGVETEHQLDLLREMGAERAQGYLMSRPVDVAATTELLQARIVYPRVARAVALPPAAGSATPGSAPTQ